MRILGLITARGGSKGVPRKNLRSLGGRPLIAWTIDAARAARRLARTIVSTDDDEIARVARDCGADVPFMRPARLATDTASSIDVAVHALDALDTRDERDTGDTGDTADTRAAGPFDAVLILQPTSPFRTGADIDAACAILEESGADSVMSMVRIEDFSRRKLKVIGAEGRILPFLDDEGPTSSRRDEGGEPVYRRNCAIYLTRAAVLRRGDLFGADSRAYVMPAERSLDINTEHDLRFAEFSLSNRGSQ